MSELSTPNIRRLDLTLLLVFLGLVKHRKAALVAKELGLTQSAISQALKRLRDILGDELFLRRPHGMEPTATALALEEPIAQAVETLRGVLGATRRFDPATATDRVRIAALDSEQAVLIPSLIEQLQSSAPGLRLSVVALGRQAALEALEEGRVDLALGYLWDLPDLISHAPLYEETYQVVGRPEVLPRAPLVDLDTYCRLEHILISPSGDLRGIVDEQLERMGRNRRVRLGLPAFLPAFAAVGRSNCVVTLPKRLAVRYASTFGLVMAEPPLEVRRFPVSVHWHRRNDGSSKCQWIVERLVQSPDLKPAKRA